ncbi:hypothetical protein SRABI26_04678 [Arthrobacter sp. Bi26]|nr:hypothetical protein SRABI26_04678 [Arthrobacter sp. Bi26]
MGSIFPPWISALTCASAASTAATGPDSSGWAPDWSIALACARSWAVSTTADSRPLRASSRLPATLVMAPISTFVWCRLSSAARTATAARLFSPAASFSCAAVEAFCTNSRRSLAWLMLSATWTRALSAYLARRSVSDFSALAILASASAAPAPTAARACGAFFSSSRRESKSAFCSCSEASAASARRMISPSQLRCCSSVSGMWSSSCCCSLNDSVMWPLASCSAFVKLPTAESPYWAWANPSSCSLDLMASSASISSESLLRRSSVTLRPASGSACAPCDPLDAPAPWLAFFRRLRKYR